MKERQVEQRKDMENMEENSKKNMEIMKERQKIVKCYGKYGRKGS